jgi:hypothetical protein
MTVERLYRRPKHTEDVLGEITSGASTAEEVAEGLYLRGWSDVTIKTRANRLSPWLTYTGLAEEFEKELVLTEEI